MIGRETIWRRRAEALPEDDRGNIEFDWDSEEILELPIDDCVVTPGATDELAVGRDTTLIQWTVIIEYRHPDIRATDRIRLKDGKLYDIDGEPARWPSPSGLLDSTVLFLRKWVD